MAIHLAENLEKFRAVCADTACRLVAVSKTKPPVLLQEAYDLGVRVFGENKVQELVEKHEELPKDIEWHMVGHLQRNKVKYIVPFVSLIHAVDSLRLLREINKRSAAVGRVVPCLLQVHIAQEENKFGFDEEEIRAVVEAKNLAQLPNICVKGLMGMATHTDDKKQIALEFGGLRRLFDALKTATQNIPNADFCELSMGMTNDYEIALEQGSTLIRIGSAIFGERT